MAPVSEEELRERVQRGIEWLDTVRPAWRDKVKVQELLVAFNCHCVLGQVFNDPEHWADGFKKVCMGFIADAVLPGTPYEYGFDSSGGYDEEFTILQRLWTEVLQGTTTNEGDQ